MKDKISWSSLMESRTEIRNKIQTPTLVAVIIGVHVMAVGSVMFIQGCGTVRDTTTTAEPTPVVVMPPVEDARPTPPPAVFQPPVAAPSAPARIPDASPEVYEVQRGDSLGRIASRHGVTTAELIDLNNISDPNTIRIGQKLLLPAHAKKSAAPRATTPAPSAPAPSAPAATATGSKYVVQSGDSLSRIASRHGVTVAALSAANNITDPNRIRVGQELVIPGGTAAPSATRTETPARTSPQVDTAPRSQQPVLTPAPAETTRPVTPRTGTLPDTEDAFRYEVKANDTLDNIARDFAVLKEDIIAMNGLTEGQPLRPGQTLLIPPMR